MGIFGYGSKEVPYEEREEGQRGEADFKNVDERSHEGIDTPSNAKSGGVFKRVMCEEDPSKEG